MHASASIREFDLDLDPLELLAAWPEDRPLLALTSRGTIASRARWSFLAEPRAWWEFDGAGTGDPADLTRVLDERLGDVRPRGTGGTRAAPSVRDPDLPPFRSGWIGVLGFELGTWFEPALGAPPPPDVDGAWPPLILARCDGALAHDRVSGRWFACGDAELPRLGARAPRASTGGDDSAPPFEAGPLRSSMSNAHYHAAVNEVLELIAAGDAFQVNLTRRLCAPFRGSRRSLAQTALATSAVPYGAYLELPGDRTLVSMSPELFLELDAGGPVATRPLKGTRPEDSDPAALATSEKDAAELHMIVDLMRNDLGRVSAFGSVQVAQERTIETHPSVHHGVAEVSARLREGVTRGELLRATFPPGSVTGAPKIRAVQIINAVEPVRRGPYCGAIGYFDDAGGMTLNVAIRTIMVQNDTLAYGTGGGIVADSVAALEHAECGVKTDVLRRVLARARVPVSVMTA